MSSILLRHPAKIGMVVAALYLFLATPWARAWLEASMTTHMLVQMPLLAIFGIIITRVMPIRWQNTILASVGGSVPCVIAALFASSYWMLPRALDAALTDPGAEAAKFLTLPLLVGVPLALAWRRLTLIGRGFVWTNFFSMLAVLGWLYIVAPVRVCNSYLVNDQEHAGWYMVILAILLFAWWLGTLLVGDNINPDKPGSSGSARA